MSTDSDTMDIVAADNATNVDYWYQDITNACVGNLFEPVNAVQAINFRYPDQFHAYPVPTSLLDNVLNPTLWEWRPTDIHQTHFHYVPFPFLRLH